MRTGSIVKITIPQSIQKLASSQGHSCLGSPLEINFMSARYIHWRERAWKILVTCCTLMTFHGHSFELVGQVTHVSTNASIDYERQYMWASPTTNSKPRPWNVINVQHVTKIFKVLSLCWSSVHKMNQFAQGERESGSSLGHYQIFNIVQENLGAWNLLNIM